jgi:ribosomal protein L29
VVILVLTTTLYDQDFYAWTQQQVEILLSGRLEELDIDNLVEEIESLGKQQRQELRNRLGVLLGHLLKCRFQPDARSKSWVATIREQRREIQELLDENPSLKPYLAEAICKSYPKGLDLVDRETPILMSDLPPVCPFSEAEIFDEPMEWDIQQLNSTPPIPQSLNE